MDHDADANVEQGGGVEAHEHRKPRRWLRPMALALSAVFVLIIMTGALLPMLLSTSPGTQILIGLVNGFTGNSVQVEDVSLGWSSGQEIRGLTVQDPDGVMIASVSRIEAPAVSLLAAVRGQVHLGSITLLEPTVKVRRRERSAGPADGSERRAPVSKPPEGAGRQAVLPQWQFKLIVKDGRVSYVSEDPADTIDVLISDAVVELLDPTHLDLSLDAKVVKADHSGRIGVDCTVDNLVDEQGRFTLDVARIDVTGNLVDVPAGFLDETWKLDGLLESIAGRTLDAEVHAEGHLKELAGTLAIRSDRLGIQGTIGRNENEPVVATGTASLHLTEQSWSALATRYPALAGKRLVNACDVAVSLDQLRLPAQPGKNQFVIEAVNAHLTASNIVLEAGHRIGLVKLAGLNIVLGGESLADRIDVQLSATAVQGDSTGELDVTATITDLFPEGNLDFRNSTTVVEGVITNLPSALFDPWLSTEDTLAEVALGPRLNIKLLAELPPSSETGVRIASYMFEAGSENLAMDFRGTVDLESRHLVSDGSLEVTATPELVLNIVEANWDRLPPMLRPLELAGPTTTNLTVQGLEVPLGSPLDLKAVTGVATVDIGRIVAHGVPMLADTDVETVYLKLTKAAGTSELRIQTGLTANYGGHAQGLAAEGSVTELDGHPRLQNASCTLDLTIGPKFVGWLKSSELIQLPAEYAALSLEQPVQVRAAVVDVNLPLLDKNCLSELNVTVALLIDEIRFAGIETLEGLAIRELRVKVPNATPGKAVNFEYGLQVAHSSEFGAVAGTGTMSLFEAAPVISTTVALRNIHIPLSLLGRFQSHAPVILSGDISGRYAAHDRLTADGTTLRLDVPRLTYQALTEPQEEDLVGPTGYRLTLEQDLRLTLELEKFEVALRPEDAVGSLGLVRFDPHRSSAVARFAIPSAAFMLHQDGQAASIRLENVVASLTAEDLDKPVTVVLGGAAVTRDPDTGKEQKSPLQSTTRLSGVLSPESHDLGEGMRFETTTQLTGLPLALIDALAAQEGRITAIGGPLAGLEVTGQVPGALNIHLSSATVDVPVNLRIDEVNPEGKLNERYSIALNHDVKAKLVQTEQNLALLADIHPVFSDAMVSDRPLLFHLRKDPFSVPANLKKNIEALALDLTIDIGELKMRRRGWLAEGLDDVTSIAANIGRAFRDTRGQKAEVQTYVAKFTPLRVQVSNGWLKPSELWVTSADLVVGFQGKVNLETKRYGFVMGILGASMISQEPLLVELIDPSNIYDLPIRGVVGSEPVIIKDEFTTAMSGSLVKQQIGRAGKEVQGLFDELIGKRVQEERRAKYGIKWNMPKDGLALIASVTHRKKDKSTKKDGQAAESQGRDQKQRKQDEPLEDLERLLELFK